MDAPRCAATSKRSGQRCKRRPSPGAKTCYIHGGRTALASLRVIEEQALAELARLDLPPVEDPLSELARVCAQVLAWKDSMAGKVNKLDELRYEGKGDAGGEQLRAEVALWERALDRCERFLTAMARLNIDERLTRISEERAELIISVLSAALERTVDQATADLVLTAFDEEFARQAGVTL